MMLQRLRLLYLKNILQQNPSSMVYKFFQLQVENPTQGDWASTCFKDFQQLEIYESFEEIKSMKYSWVSLVLAISEEAILARI